MSPYDYLMAGRPATTPAQLGATIRDVRKAVGLTQSELADRAGVSRRWLLMLENGNAPGAELSKVLTTLAALDLRLTVDAVPPRRDIDRELERLLDEDDL